MLDCSLLFVYYRIMRINHHALKEIRERSGMSVTALAAEAGISKSYLSDVENNNRKPSADVIKRLALALKVPVPAIVELPSAFEEKVS